MIIIPLSSADQRTVEEATQEFRSAGYRFFGRVVNGCSVLVGVK